MIEMDLNWVVRSKQGGKADTFKEIKLPFVPQIGMSIHTGTKAGAMTVCDVRIDPQEGTVTIELEDYLVETDEDLDPWIQEFKQTGWD